MNNAVGCDGRVAALEACYVQVNCRSATDTPTLPVGRKGPNRLWPSRV